MLAEPGDRDENDLQWRYLAGTPDSIGLPLLEPGQSTTVDVVAGRNDIKMIAMANREITRPVHARKSGGCH